MQVLKQIQEYGSAAKFASRVRDGLRIGLASVFLVFTCSLSWSETRAPEEIDSEAQILGVVTSLFDGMRKNDAALIRQQFTRDARLGLLSVADFVDRVGSSNAYLDEVTFDETVLIDGDLAMAWTPYNLYVDGEFHHCGVDVFVMKRIDDQWLISHLEDTRRTAGCDPNRLRPTR
ncbi:MAG: nuclear transport factor 2 family protein [Pseudomonadota bacterium]